MDVALGLVFLVTTVCAASALGRQINVSVPLLLVLAGVGMAAFTVVASVAGLRFAEDDGPWLVAWAAEHLEAPAPTGRD